MSAVSDSRALELGFLCSRLAGALFRTCQTGSVRAEDRRVIRQGKVFTEDVRNGMSLLSGAACSSPPSRSAIQAMPNMVYVFRALQEPGQEGSLQDFVGNLCGALEECMSKQPPLDEDILRVLRIARKLFLSLSDTLADEVERHFQPRAWGERWEHATA